MKSKDSSEKKIGTSKYFFRIACCALFYLACFVFGPFIDTFEQTHWNIFSSEIDTFLIAGISSVIIILLIPPIIFGSFDAKIIAAILIFPALWFGYMYWEAIVFYYFFGIDDL
ncbi:MAG TPA: hypothetical protein VGM58_08740 [Verrucomicrobiae bacterium]|jgi:hypothetical protein